MRIEKTVDRGSKEKLYVQIYSIFLEKILSGEWPDGAQIPPEDELCRMYEVSKVTVREAIHELVREGYLRRQQGRGTFVTYSISHPGILVRTRLLDNIHGEEVTLIKEIVEKGVRGPSDEVKKVLMTDEDIYYVASRKVVNSERYHEEFFIPLFILPDIDKENMADRSLYDLIEEKGTKKIFKVMQTIEVTMLQENLAALLSMGEGSPAILVSRIHSSLDGSPIAYSRLIGGGREHKFQMEFERIK
jgi:DNA-binding GntR family transcriptional regulator